MTRPVAVVLDLGLGFAVPGFVPHRGYDFQKGLGCGLGRTPLVCMSWTNTFILLLMQKR
ncbi:hypothetical protein B0T22DRAFT_452598 [Podospora appendiculata]|uniref:Uncharacterized protein n=1 Tax=Podospora appendiculata TaxID=314037 RepID=A0AAE1CH62_9PEZI|nr:hypothetical protein B0T22DRAFT_452598 [Podospora appendiculata]